MRRLIAMVVLAASLLMATPTEPADAHIDWSPAFNICNLITTVEIEYATGYNWNVYRATDFNLFGYFGVGCTVHPAPGGTPTYNFYCFIYVRETHDYGITSCPTPP